MTSIESILPHNLDLEREALGAMLNDPEVFLKARESLRPDDFYRPANAQVYAAMCRLTDRQEPTDVLSVRDGLGDTLEEIGGMPYLTALQEYAGFGFNIDLYCVKLRKLALRRSVIAACKEVEGAAYNDDESDDPTELLTTKALELSDDRTSHIKTQSAVVHAVCNRLQSYEKGDRKQGVSFGIPRIDDVTYGVCPGDFVVVAARPSEGKSVLLGDVAMNAALSGVPTLVFSMEMSAEALTERMVFSKSRVDSTIMRTGSGDTEAWARVMKACGDLADIPITWEDYPIPLPVMQAKARRWHLKHVEDTGVIVLDYIQLVDVQSGKRSYNRSQELGDLTRALKQLSRLPGVAVVAAAALNRDSKKRESGRPALHDLREAGTLEFDLDKGIFIHNPPEGIITAGMRDCELAVLKHRNGGTCGWFSARFHGGQTRFYQVDENADN